MAQESRALTELVQGCVGRGKRWTVRAFVERAVDPATGYAPSTGLVGKIIRGLEFKVTPQLISALAVGMDMRRERVAAAAHAQYIGYDVNDLAPDAHKQSATVRMAHEPGADGSDLPKVREWLAAQEVEK